MSFYLKIKTVNIFMSQLTRRTRTIVNDLINDSLLGLGQRLDVLLRDVADLDDPPGQDGDVGDRSSGQQFLVTSSEQRAGESSKLGLGSGLVHQLYVLIATNTKKSETINCSKVGERIVALLLTHYHLQNHDVILKRSDSEAFDNHI